MYIINTPSVITDFKTLKSFLEKVKRNLTELDKSYGTDFFTESSASGAVLAHIIFAKCPNAIRRELMNRSGERYPSQNNMSHVFEVMEYLLAALLDVRREICAPKMALSSPKMKAKMARSSPREGVGVLYLLNCVKLQIIQSRTVVSFTPSKQSVEGLNS